MNYNPARQICQTWTRRHVSVDASGLRVLVVDDNVDAAQALGAYLGSGKIECRLAYGGEDAVRIGTAWRPHIIVMDITMPGCSGFEAALALRRDERTRGIAIIAFTSLDEREVREHLTDGEFDGYCQKGHGPTRLAALITRLAH
jgi:two-component system OmpR family response regulator